jgi:hypothetical protein
MKHLSSAYYGAGSEPSAINILTLLMWSSQHPCDPGVIFILILQMRKLDIGRLNNCPKVTHLIPIFVLQPISFLKGVFSQSTDHLVCWFYFFFVCVVLGIEPRA